MTGPREPGRGGRWIVALVALPVLCCAGPVLLTALGAGSLGALAGSVTGSFALGGLTVAFIVVAVIARNIGRR